MEEKMYYVKNRSTSMTCYSIPEMNIRREFAPGETKKLSYEELRQLTYQPGGVELIAGYLQLDAAEVLDNLGIQRELEYNMSEKDVVDLLTNGSLDSFLDALDFAPPGVIDLIKVFAVKLPLGDFNKRQALLEKTGFDVDRAIANLTAEKAEEAEATKTQIGSTPGRQRRVQPANAEVAVEAKTQPARRTAPPKYKVVSQGE